jgi:tetratricopeptide (TPR) repeat protein
MRRSASDGVGESYTAFQIAMCQRAQALQQAPNETLGPRVLEAFAAAAKVMAASLPNMPANSKSAGDFHHNLAFCLEQQVQFAAALNEYQAVLRRRNAANDLRGEAYTHNRMAVCEAALGRYPEAIQSLNKALRFYRAEKILPRIEAAELLLTELEAKKEPLR